MRTRWDGRRRGLPALVAFSALLHALVVAGVSGGHAPAVYARPWSATPPPRLAVELVWQGHAVAELARATTFAHAPLAAALAPQSRAPAPRVEQVAGRAPTSPSPASPSASSPAAPSSSASSPFPALGAPAADEPVALPMPIAAAPAPGPLRPSVFGRRVMYPAMRVPLVAYGVAPDVPAPVPGEADAATNCALREPHADHAHAIERDAARCAAQAVPAQSASGSSNR